MRSSKVNRPQMASLVVVSLVLAISYLSFLIPITTASRTIHAKTPPAPKTPPVKSAPPKSPPVKSPPSKSPPSKTPPLKKPPTSPQV
ncbi:hypothetical protein HanHA300_Chr08g0288151 [Helianthus annuus]|nr:hypothetical protein HanHA300_Chr08g0288151 [Helianthus annuus]KAJ0554329.1 hypothetical protein HanHA89_Chr08g0306501 [Helianthus annuus]KAJ0719923.1 hypothetical protein HanLR1_Chr08g0287201 [Helianthus annuus]